jgi:hypothetical protein
LWLAFQGSCLGRGIAAVGDDKYSGPRLKIPVFAGTEDPSYRVLEFL